MTTSGKDYVEQLRAAERARKLAQNPKLQFLALPGARDMVATAFDAGVKSVAEKSATDPSREGAKK